MTPDYGEDVYLALSKIVTLKFKSQINNSGITFKEISKMIDLLTKEESYLLITNKGIIRFSNQQEFIQKFINLIRKSLSELNDEYEELQKQGQQVFVDENWLFNEHERVGLEGEKQVKLLKKMQSFVQANR